MYIYMQALICMFIYIYTYLLVSYHFFFSRHLSLLGLDC